MIGEIPRREPDRLGRDSLALEVFHRADGRVLGHAEHPADRAAADLRENQFGHLVDVGIGLHDPVVAGQTAVEHALFDITGHLLRADQQTLDPVVVDRGIVASRTEGDFVPGAPKQLGGGFLQAAGGNSQFQKSGHGVEFGVG